MDYKWWILLKPELQSWEGDGKENISEASHEVESNESQCSVTAEEIEGEGCQRGVCLCVCVCVCVCVSM